MKKTFLLNLFSLLFFILIPLHFLNAAGGHKGNITALIHKGNTVISSGEDGFIVTWNLTQRAAVERFQLTTYKIQTMISHPLKDEICIIEASMDIYRISVWNYARKEKIFSVFSDKPVTYINYSSNGSFIITAGLNGSALSLLNSSTGEIISDNIIPEGAVAFGITGRAERNILVYQAESEDYTGQILYVDLNSGSVTAAFNAPSNLSSPVIFDNNRFLSGINSSGLQLVDAASGAVLDSARNIERDALLYPLDSGFYCLNRRELISFSVDRNGKLVTRQRISLSLNANAHVSAIAFNENMVFASAHDILLFEPTNNRITALSFNFQKRITEIAAGENTIALLTENNDLFFLPTDYRQIKNSQSLTFTKKNNYSRITAFPLSGEDNFILWQTANTRTASQLLSAERTDGRNLNFLFGRSPLRAISAFGGKLLVLDTGGNITVRGLETLTASTSAQPDFTFSSIGTIDASIINNENIILCRSAANNNSPFLSVNIKTGETVPRFFPAQTGLTVYSGGSGNVYAAVIERDDEGLQTIFINLSNSTAQESRVIFKYPGEAVHFSIAESSGRLAIACDSEGAKIYGNQIFNFERTNGLPVKLLAKRDFFLCIDSEGNIAWHDNSGKIQAVFSLYEDRWTLSSNGEETTGEISRP